MSEPLSTHLPELAGGIVSVTGSKVVDTGLRDLQTADVSLIGTITANEESVVTWEKVAQAAGGTQKITIRVYKGGTSHGTVGDSAVNVSWWALGK